MSVRFVASAALDAAVTVATIAGIALVATHAVVFGSAAGNWIFPYVASLERTVGVVAVVGALLVVVLYEAVRRRVDARPSIVVLVVLAGGIGVQLMVRALSPHAMADAVVSDVANGFYGAAGRVQANQLLADFARVSSWLPLHAQHNMPGKLLLYQGLRAVTLRADVLAVVIVVLSSLCGVFLYGTCARMFGSRAAGLDAMALWMLVPSKIGFLPLLNVVSPLPALAAVWCMTRYLETPALGWAASAGVLAYVTAIFDPLALWIGIVFAPLILRAVVLGQVRWVQAILLLAVSAVSLVGSHAVMRWATGFDLWHALVGKTQVFGDQPFRPYEIWVVVNLKDVALAAGPAVAVAFVAACLLGAWTVVRAAVAGNVRGYLDAGSVTAAMTLAVLVALEAIGFERGEVARLWIFLLAPVQVVVAWCVSRSHAPTRWLVLGGTFAFAAATVATVGYCVP